MEKLESFVATENPEAFQIYNETIRALKLHCTRYLLVLDSGRYYDKGGTTKLDHHHAGLCRRNVEGILERIRINGELPNNNYMKIAMIHAYQYLRKLRDIYEDVSGKFVRVDKKLGKNVEENRVGTRFFGITRKYKCFPRYISKCAEMSFMISSSLLVVHETVSWCFCLISLSTVSQISLSG